jgi:hypothetical protein
MPAILYLVYVYKRPASYILKTLPDNLETELMSTELLEFYAKESSDDNPENTGSIRPGMCIVLALGG